MVAGGLDPPVAVADAAPLRAAAGDVGTDVLAVAADVLGEIRKAKTEAKRSMRTEVARAVVRDTPERVAALRPRRRRPRRRRPGRRPRHRATASRRVDVELAPPE